jgi:hypothetical protein
MALACPSPVLREIQVLLSLEAFSKKTRKTPPPKIELAERRLADLEAAQPEGLDGYIMHEISS